MSLCIVTLGLYQITTIVVTPTCVLQLPCSALQFSTEMDLRHKSFMDLVFLRLLGLHPPSQRASPPLISVRKLVWDLADSLLKMAPAHAGSKYDASYISLCHYCNVRLQGSEATNLHHRFYMLYSSLQHVIVSLQHQYYSVENVAGHFAPRLQALAVAVPLYDWFGSFFLRYAENAPRLYTQHGKKCSVVLSPMENLIGDSGQPQSQAAFAISDTACKDVQPAQGVNAQEGWQRSKGQ